MSELIKENRIRAKWQLLASVSALALIANAAVPNVANAEDSNRPAIWIELGGQLERVDGNALPFVPVFSDTAIEHGLPPPASVQKGAKYGYGGEGSIILAPQGSSWEFSASIRYGRSNASKSKHQQTAAPRTPNPGCLHCTPTYGQPYLTMVRRFITSDNRSTFKRNTVVVDFKAGKDVGLGLFGNDNSRFDLGIRFAQFASSATLNAYGIPYPHWEEKYLAAAGKYRPAEHSIAYHATAQARRSFSGIGPTLTWHDSANLAQGTTDSLALTFDWGINGGILFGRQKAKVHYKTKIIAKSPDYAPTPFSVEKYRTSYRGPFSTNRAHSVIVPNIGGRAALSLTFPNAKVTFGYRADFFFGAMDGGIETRRSNNLSFHGPFASISVGLGG